MIARERLYVIRALPVLFIFCNFLLSTV